MKSQILRFLSPSIASRYYLPIYSYFITLTDAAYASCGNLIPVRLPINESQVNIKIVYGHQHRGAVTTAKLMLMLNAQQCNLSLLHHRLISIIKTRGVTVSI